MEVVPSRIWFLGQANLGGRSREMFLARGLHLHGAAGALKNASRLRASRTRVVFVPNAAPSPEIWAADQPPVIPLSTMLSLEPAGLVIDQGYVEAVLNPEFRTGSATQKPIVANAFVRSRGSKMRRIDLDQDGYDRLVAAAEDFDVFADGLKRTVAKHIGKKRERNDRVRISYFQTIRAALEKKANYDPGTEGPQGDTDSGRQTFQRARKIFDIGVGKNRALFKTDMTDYHAVYRFDPDPSVSFALVFPAKA